METLPVYVIPDIAKHLSVKDLAACCAVSPWWRDLFGIDEVWKPRCDVDTGEYLRTTPCRVEPKFATPESENTTLSPIGRWRSAFLREVHLMKNWISGNCVEEKLSLPIVFYHEIFFLNNDHIILLAGNSVELRDTAVSPSVLLAQFENPCDESPFEVKVVSNTIIAVCSRIKVQMIEFNAETHTFSEKFTFIGSVLGNFLLVDNVFLAYDEKYMYVWNIENGTRLRTESCPLSRANLCSIDSYENCEDVIVYVSSNLKIPRPDHHVFIYSVKELRFFGFTKTGKCISVCTIVNHCFFLFPKGGGLEVYDYHTSCLIHRIELPIYRYESLHIMGNSFIFSTEEDKLMQVSLSTRSVRCLHSGISTIESINYKERTDRKLFLLRGKNGITQILFMLGFEPVVITPNLKVPETRRNQVFSKILIPEFDFGREYFGREYMGCTCVNFW